MKHDFRIDVDSGVEPHFLLLRELDLLLVDSNTIRVSREVLVVVVGVELIPVLDGCSGSADAEPLTEVATLRQRRCGGVSSARQPDQPGWRARPICVQKRHIRAVRDLHPEFFEHGSSCLEELRSVQPQSSSAE